MMVMMSDLGFGLFFDFNETLFGSYAFSVDPTANKTLAVGR